MPDETNPEKLVTDLRAIIARGVAEHGSDTRALKPAHRVKFFWPPHPISYEFHVPTTEWRGRATLHAHGETFDVVTARTPYGVFGRCEAIWHEDRGESEEQMLGNLRTSAEPLFKRQRLINAALGRSGRFIGHVPDLSDSELLALLYCQDRDVSFEAMSQIELHASNRSFFPALVQVLLDREHPYRRAAQWCVLDLFEDLPAFAHTEEDARSAVKAMRDLLWDADDDYARTIFKAGVVLGGHVPTPYGANALLECLHAPSRIGRRSAIHGLFHVVEWVPDIRESVVHALQVVADSDAEPLLHEFASYMARDIANENTDHVQEPMFSDEP